VGKKFAALAAQISATAGKPASAQDIAEGFLTIAVANMAKAIKQISIERGHDVTQYTLVAFGGAAGQHACMVADALGMKRVMLHPLAGVLSAYGIGLAALKTVRERTMNVPLDGAAAALDAASQALASEGAAALAGQGAAASQIHTHARAELRYDGVD